MKTIKKGNFLKLGILALFVLMIFGCSKKCSTEPETSGYWNHYLFENTYNNFITNGITFDNDFYCTNFSGIVHFSDFELPSTTRFVNGISTGYNNKPTIANNFAVMLCDNTSNSLYISKLEEVDLRNTFFSPDLCFDEISNSTFTLLNNLIEIGAVNTQNRFVTTIEADLKNERKHYIIYLDIDSDKPNYDLIIDGGYWELPNSSGGFGVTIRDIYAYNDIFYLSYTLTDGSNYYLEIHSDNSLITHSNPFEDGTYIVTFFEYLGYLWAHKSDTGLSYSADGVNWNNIGHLEPYMFDFIEIENFLFVHINDKIYCIGDSIDEMKLYEIPNNNIVGSTITSICKLDNNFVITTSNGIFYKSFSSIMNDKVLIRNQLNIIF
jgi:hypothetical protein